jgi:two-component system response regulator HydG
MNPSDVTVLVVEDDRSNLESLERIFAKEGYRVLCAEGARPALDLLRKQRVHVIVTDLMMPGTSGMDLLKAAKAVSPETEVVLMTAYGTIETAVEAMRAGAYDFVEKPLKRINITKTVAKAAERASLVAENRTLRQEITALRKREIVGHSPALRQVLEVAAQAAPSTATVLILGETGSGKELLARYVHTRSNRAQGPFVAVNCAAIPETLIEAELFGHEKGAFTGAAQRKDGRFALAKGGTLFLDEIGELSPSVQVKLLRVLQEGEFEPLGGRTVRADVRVVAATNRNLEEEVKAGRFREDLYFRLNVIAITMPPLRARPGDVPLLVDHFLAVFSAKNSKGPFTITPAAIEKLQDYAWPGNVRELENTIERAVVLSQGPTIGVRDLGLERRTTAAAPGDSLIGMPAFGSSTAIPIAAGPDGAITLPGDLPLEEAERRYARAVLDREVGNRSAAARALGISRNKLARLLKP